jgi:hypothetical protein
MLILAQDTFVEIDVEDLEHISGYFWRINSNGYAVTGRAERTILMHRMLTGAKKGQLVDHASGDGLNNRRSNMRICTPAENSRNRRIAKSNKSGYKGVYADRSRQRVRWRAQIRVDDTTVRLGSFPTAELAYEAYCEAATQYHGEYARLS